MAQFPRETNIAVKEGIDALFGDGQTTPLFAAPVASMDDLIARGLVDETGTATDRGVLFTQLQDAGMFDERGAMTPKAHAYAMDYAEVVGGGERTLDAYKARMADGIDNPDVSWSDTLDKVGEYAWDAGAGLVNMIKLANKEIFSFGESASETKKREAETAAAMTAGMEGAMKANFELAGMLGVADAHVVNEWFYDAPEQEREKRVWLARQQRDKISYDNQSAKIGETMESFLPVDGVTEQMAAAKQTLGKPAFDMTVKQGDAIGQMGTPDMLIPSAAATKAATTGSKISRAMLGAERIIGKRAAAATRLAAKELEQASAARIAGAAEKTAAQARRTAGSLTARFEATGDQVLGQGARRASEIAAEHAALAERSTKAAAEAAAEVERLSAQASKLTTLIPEQAAQRFMQTVEVGRKIKALPANALGATLEKIGSGLTAGDTAITGFLKEKGLDQLYTATVAASGTLGIAVNPVFGAVGGVAGVLKTGKLIESYGKLIRYVGKEMVQARGQIPFWQRVAAHTAPGSLNRGIAHTFGVFELGGATSDIIRRTGRGVMAAAPADLAFEWLADDGDISANTFKQAFAESLVIGGSFAAAGGAFMGTKHRMRELAVGDELNFRKGLIDTRQKGLFEAIPRESRRAIATYSIANPTLNFNFTDKGASHYDPPTNTATINITSTNPLKALLGHEVLHHTVIKNNMEGGIAALFLGDTKGDGNGNFVTGGLLRAKDGTLDTNFGEFVETYNRRMDNAGAERPGLDALAVEYFIEQHSDQYSDMAQSGALGALAARGAARRGLGSILDTVLPRTPVLKDLHFKMGGIMDGTGAMVTGNGLLGFGGIRQLPASNRMFRDMNRRSSGRVPGQFEPLGTDKPDGGAAITLNPASSIDLGLMHPMIVVDDAGNPVLQGGKPVFIDKATDMLRGAAGITVMERLRENKAAGKRHAPGEMHLDENGEVQGRWLSPDVLREVIAKNKFNPEQAQVMRSVNAAIKTGDGSRMVVINFPATKKLKNGKTVYAPQAATIRDIVPVGLTITKDGNLQIGLMSVTKLTENIQKRAKDKRGKRLYGGNTDLILQDVRAMMDFHKRGEDSIAHFAEKYGAVEADERKKFINTMFGLLNKSEQAALNPLLLDDGVTSRDNVFRTYRVDRVSKAVPMAPDQHQPMPFNYEAAKKVLLPGMPDGSRMLPEPGTPAHDAAYLEAAESGDMETAQRMVDQAEKSAGYDVNAFHGTNANAYSESEFTVFHTRGERGASFFSSRHGEASNYGEKVYNVALAMKNPLVIDAKGLSWAELGGAEVLSKPTEALEQKRKNFTKEADQLLRDLGIDVDETSPLRPIKTVEDLSVSGTDTDALAKFARKYGYDGAIFKNVKDSPTAGMYANELQDTFAVFDPSQIKSADAITRDDSGKIIPLSERFNAKKSDIRYLPEPLDGGGKAPVMKIHEDTGKVNGQEVTTGKPVTFQYLHNKESATVIHGKPKNGDTYDRHLEPSSRFLVATESANLAEQFPKQYEAGSVTFKNPIVIGVGEYRTASSWKKRVSDSYGGLTGKRLSKAIIESGHDGIITIGRDGHSSEIVDFTTFEESKARYLPEPLDGGNTGGQVPPKTAGSGRAEANPSLPANPADQRPPLDRGGSTLAGSSGQAIGSVLAGDERFSLPGATHTLDWRTLGLVPGVDGMLQKQAMALREFAYDNKKTIVRKEYPKNFIAEGGEHVVERHPKDRTRVIKYAKEFGFSLFIDMPNMSDLNYRAVDLRKSLPSEYFERMELQNKYFGDDIRIDGLTWGGNPVITQKFIKGEKPPQPEIDAYMVDLGFEKVDAKNDVTANPVNGTVWFHPTDGILVGDARPDNFRKVADGSLVPIDLVISRADPANVANIKPKK